MSEQDLASFIPDPETRAALTQRYNIYSVLGDPEMVDLHLLGEDPDKLSRVAKTELPNYIK